jgi:hypothetical protein
VVTAINGQRIDFNDIQRVICGELGRVVAEETAGGAEELEVEAHNPVSLQRDIKTIKYGGQVQQETPTI